MAKRKKTGTTLNLNPTGGDLDQQGAVFLQDLADQLGCSFGDHPQFELMRNAAGDGRVELATAAKDLLPGEVMFATEFVRIPFCVYTDEKAELETESAANVVDLMLGMRILKAHADFHCLGMDQSASRAKRIAMGEKIDPDTIREAAKDGEEAIAKASANFRAGRHALVAAALERIGHGNPVGRRVKFKRKQSGKPTVRVACDAKCGMVSPAYCMLTAKQAAKIRAAKHVCCGCGGNATPLPAKVRKAAKPVTTVAKARARGAAVADAIAADQFAKYYSTTA